MKRLSVGALALALLLAPLLGRPVLAMAVTPAGLTSITNPNDPGNSGYSDGALGNDDGDQGMTARAAGIATGEIAAVDYQRGYISVITQQHGRIDVQVLPSTNIHGRDDSFLTIGDLNRGSRVEIFLSIIGSRYVAQIIRLI